MKIAIDLNGGDFAPQAVVDGINLALDQDFVKRDELVGIGSPIAGSLLFQSCNVEYVEGEKELSNVPRQLTSIGKGIRGIKTGEFNAFVSAGNTKIAVGLSVASLGRLKDGIKPAIAAPLPYAPASLLLDIGASVDRMPMDYLDLAFMGTLYATSIWRIERPTISLLNIGEEPDKGGVILKEAFRMLREKFADQFIGNTEGDKIFLPHLRSNVVICDGFAGNLMLKIWECLMKNSQIADWEKIGGLPLLGVKGLIIIAHGKSTPVAIASAIHSAAKVSGFDINSKLSLQLK